MTTKTFPKFASHQVVSCFNCEGDLIGNYVFSGHARGRGEFVQACDKCRMSTWYDIKARDYADKHSDEWATEAATPLQFAKRVVHA